MFLRVYYKTEGAHTNTYTQTHMRAHTHVFTLTIKHASTELLINSKCICLFRLDYLFCLRCKWKMNMLLNVILKVDKLRK